ncbi:MAG: patatin-like phospholipase family protein, partial [Candidatus Magasanikbacteria bacterium]|nr:patatin-like phospholipase family protein [Candidatus Magasanikbacteria bacterium]
EKFYAFIEPTIDGGLIKGTKMEKLIDTWLLGKNFEDTKIPFCAVATDLISGNSIVLNTDKLAPALRASMSIPTLFAPFAYKNYLLVDGGISQPVPDEVVKQMGADIVISVNLDNYIKNDNFAVEKQNSLRYVATRSINVIRYHLSKYSTTHSDIIIEPYTPTVGASSFRDYFAQKIAGTKLVENGEIETEKVIEKIKELMSD